MRRKLNTRFISMALVILMMLPLMMPILTAFAADETTYVLNADTLAPVSAGAKADVKDQRAVEHLKNVGTRYVVKQKNGQQALKADLVGDLQEMLVPQAETSQHVPQQDQQKNGNNYVRRE